MTNWRTNLGGALGTLGTAISGLATANTITQFNGSGTISELNLYLILIGSAISCIGKFFTAIFAADAAEVRKTTAAQNEKIQQIADDTNTILKPVDTEKGKREG